MNMQQHPIWQSIKQLLFDHDCVIVPGFGGFVCNAQPARIDQVSHIITPPGKHVVFNQNLKNNDGLLANYWANTQQISYSEAINSIQQIVDELIRSLTENKQLEISHFGKFRLNAEANYVFIPATSNSYQYSSFGLLPLQAHAVASRQIKSPRTKIFRERKSTVATQKRTTRLWPSMLVATLVMMLGINAWIFLKDHEIQEIRLGNNELNVGAWFDTILQSENANTENTTHSPELTPELTTNQGAEYIPEAPVDAEELNNLNPSPTQELNSPITIALNVVTARSNWYLPPVFAEPILNNEQHTTPIESEVSKETTTEVSPALAVKPSTHSTGNFYIIGGVFCKEPNAEKFKNDMANKGYQAEILMNDRIHCKRVSIARFSTRTEAESYLSQVKTTINAEAWIYSAN